MIYAAMNINGLPNFLWHCSAYLLGFLFRRVGIKQECSCKMWQS